MQQYQGLVEDKELKNITKYQDLKINIERLWHISALVVPVVIGALGAMAKNVGQHLEILQLTFPSVNYKRPHCWIQTYAMSIHYNILGSWEKLNA